MISSNNLFAYVIPAHMSFFASCIHCVKQPQKVEVVGMKQTEKVKKLWKEMHYIIERFKPMIYKRGVCLAGNASEWSEA